MMTPMFKNGARWALATLSIEWVNVVVLVAASALVVGGFTTAGVEWSDSSATDWMQAIATAAAFFAATVAARYAAGVFALEEARDRRLEDAGIRHQAERVAAWVEFPAKQNWKALPKVQNEEVVLKIRNATDLPIYDVEVNIQHILRTPDQEIEERDYRRVLLLPPSIIPWAETREKLTFSLAPATGALTTAQRADLMSQSQMTTEVSIAFRDSGGRLWKREPNGELAGPLTEQR